MEEVLNWKKKPRDSVQVPKENQIPQNFCSVIRQVGRDIYLEREHVPTLDIILERLNLKTAADFEYLNLFGGDNIPSSDSPIWVWSRTSLFRFMKSNGFLYGDKVSHYKYTKNRADVISMRDNHLDWVKSYRENGYRIYYQDETWVFRNMSYSKIWKDIASSSTGNTYNVPAGKGDRSIFRHIGSAETVLLEVWLLLFRGSKSNKSSDYLTDMNWSVFSSWCESKVFPKIKQTSQKSVVVLDRATYHTFIDEEDRRPTNSWNKSKLSDAIVRWDGVPDD